MIAIFGVGGSGATAIQPASMLFRGVLIQCLHFIGICMVRYQSSLNLVDLIGWQFFEPMYAVSQYLTTLHSCWM